MFLSTAFSLPESPSSEIWLCRPLTFPLIAFSPLVSPRPHIGWSGVETYVDWWSIWPWDLHQEPFRHHPPPSCLRLFSPCILLSLSARWRVTLRLSLSLSLFIFHSVYYSFIYWHECYMSKWKSISSLPNVRSFRIMCYSRRRSVDSWFTLPRLARRMDSST